MVKWVNVAANGTGIALYDLKGRKQHVIYVFGDNKGTFSGKIRVKGDNFCYTPPRAKEVCVIVFTDGDDIYEVDKIIRCCRRTERSSKSGPHRTLPSQKWQWRAEHDNERASESGGQAKGGAGPKKAAL